MNLNISNYSRTIILFVFILLSGCSGYQYVASPHFVPLNEKKGELTTNLYLSGAQIGYSFSNKFSVFATGFRRVPSIRTTNPFQSTEGQAHRSCQSNEINIGLSYFKKRNNLIYEVLLGSGLGRMAFANDFQSDKTQDNNYSFDMTANRKNVFIQPNFSFKFNKPAVDSHLAIALFAKFNFIQYYNINTESYFGRTSKPDDGIDYFMVRTEAYLFLIEPGVLIKAGAKNFKGMCQISPNLNLSGYAMRYKVLTINIGFAMNLNLIKEKGK